jgi:CheY-like chemotaxis protein
MINQLSSKYSKIKKVLIVDDDEYSLIYLQKILKNICKELILARNGLDAIGIFKDDPDIDLILMDIKMPILDGFEATRMIRDISKDVIIIAQTAFAQKEEEQKAIKSGCNAHIAKPFKDSELFKIIRNNL